MRWYASVFGAELQSSEAYLPTVHQEGRVEVLSAAEAGDESFGDSDVEMGGGGGLTGTGFSDRRQSTPRRSTGSGNPSRSTGSGSGNPSPLAYRHNPLTTLAKSTVQVMNDNKSNLSFSVSVHLTLKPGDEGIGIGDRAALACESSNTAMKRGLSEITGSTYYPTPRTVGAATGKYASDGDK